MSFQIAIDPAEAEAAFFVSDVRRALQKALVDAESRGVTQASIARALGINRSVINRELRGVNDLMLGRVAQIAWAMGYRAVIDLIDEGDVASNHAPEAKWLVPKPEPTVVSAAEPVVRQKNKPAVRVLATAA